ASSSFPVHRPIPTPPEQTALADVRAAEVCAAPAATATGPRSRAEDRGPGRRADRSSPKRENALAHRRNIVRTRALAQLRPPQPAADRVETRQNAFVPGHR